MWLLINLLRYDIKSKVWDWEMAQLLGIPAALPEVPDFIPNTDMVAHNCS